MAKPEIGSLPTDPRTPGRFVGLGPLLFLQGSSHASHSIQRVAFEISALPVGGGPSRERIRTAVRSRVRYQLYLGATAEQRATDRKTKHADLERLLNAMKTKLTDRCAKSLTFGADGQRKSWRPVQEE